jgi:hypothetical protein
MLIPNATFASSFTSKLYAAAVHKDIFSCDYSLSSEAAGCGIKEKKDTHNRALFNLWLLTVIALMNSC